MPRVDLSEYVFYWWGLGVCTVIAVGWAIVELVRRK